MSDDIMVEMQAKLAEKRKTDQAAKKEKTPSLRSSVPTMAQAFLALQLELPVIPKSRDGYNFKYAPYEKIAELAFPYVWGHGFTIHHRIAADKVVTSLTYAATGEAMISEYTFDTQMKDQEKGKSLTYGKRYNTALLLGLSIEGEPDRDDDVPPSHSNKPTAGAGGDF